MIFCILFHRNTSGAFLLQCWNLHHLHCTLIKWGQLCLNIPSVNSHPSSGKEFLTIAAMGPANLPGPLCRRSTDSGAFTRGTSKMSGKKKGYLLSCLRSCIKPTPAKDSCALTLAFVLCHFALVWEVPAFSWHGVCRHCCVSCSVNTVWKFWLVLGLDQLLSGNASLTSAQTICYGRVRSSRVACAGVSYWQGFWAAFRFLSKLLLKEHCLFWFLIAYCGI